MIKGQEVFIREQGRQNTEKEACIMRLENALELIEERIALIKNPSKTILLKYKNVEKDREIQISPCVLESFFRKDSRYTH